MKKNTKKIVVRKNEDSEIHHKAAEAAAKVKLTKKKLVKKSSEGSYSFSGDRAELVAKLAELYEEGKIKVSDIARVGEVKSSSASCWMRGISLPSQSRVAALVDLINSVSE